MICLQCGNEFTAERVTAKYCSDACRVKVNRIETLKRAGEAAENYIKAQSKFSDPEKQKNYEAFLKQIPATQWVETNTPLDGLTKLPKNKITIVYGKYGIGKTTLSHLIAAHSKLKTLYIDTEASLSPERLVEMGINATNFTVKREAFIEDVYELLTDPKNLKKYDLIIWDSVGNTSFRTEVEGEASDRNIGIKPLIMNKLMRILPNQLLKNECTLLLINQEREGIGMYAENYIPGGKGQLYSASVIIRLTGKFPRIKAEITKSRVSDIGKIEFRF